MESQVYVCVYILHASRKDLEETGNYVPFFHLFLGRMEECSTKQQLGAKYLPGDSEYYLQVLKDTLKLLIQK